MRSETSDGFRDRVVAITGGAGGIGAALGRRFHAAGAKVCLLDLDAERAAELAAALDPTGKTAIGVGCDVTCAEACEVAIDRCREALGPVAVLINNAGITHMSRVRDTPPAVLRKVMDVNFFGATNCTQVALEDLIATRGHVVAISSVAGFAPLYGRAGYAASKHALHGFFDSLRSEVTDAGVSVSLVCPCFTDTGIQKAALTGTGERVAQNPVGKVATPDEVAEQIFDTARRRERLRVLGTIGRASYWLSRLAPAVYERIMSRSHRRVG